MSTFRRRLLTNQALRVAKGDLIYPGLVAAWSAEGKTNEDSDRNILKDLTGHGHDITLNNMAYAGMSGYGGHRNYAQGSENEVKITSGENKPNDVISLGYKVTGLKKGDIITVSLDYEAYNINFDSNSNSGISLYFNRCYGYTNISQRIISNGVNHYKKVFTLNNHYNSSDPTTEEDDGAPYVRFDYITFNEGGYFLVKNFTVVKGEEEVEWFKDYQYPNALVFDGVDDSGVCENKPIQKDFTFIYKATPLNDTRYAKGIGFSTRTYSLYGEFIIGKKPLSQNYFGYYSFGTTNYISNYTSNITYATPNIFNGQEVSKGSGKGTNVITIGSVFYEGNEFANMAFYSAYLFNKSLEESEIKSFIRKYIDPEYLLPSEIPTPDCYYDFSLGSNEDENRETIVDQSGNGNDAKAYNFAWSGMSGYGGYNTNFRVNNNRADVEILGTQHWLLKSPKDSTLKGEPIIQTSESFIGKNKTVTIYVNGLKEENTLYVRYPLTPLQNGFNTVTFNDSTEGYYVFNISGDYENLEIEILPEYPGALVLDGTDDYIALEAFDSGFKTMFMVCNPFVVSGGRMLYDQRQEILGNTSDDFAIFSDTYSTAYDSRNVNGTYINGYYNTEMKVFQLFNKKHLIHVKSKLTKGTKTPKIGTTTVGNYYAKMSVYKFLGFKEELTEDQIQYVIKKYNLLDGVDDLSVIDEISNDTLISNETLIQN